MPEPRIPKIGEFVRGTGKLVSIDQPPPPEPPPSPEAEFIFEEITARLELRRNGKVLKAIQTLNDFYGLETSIQTCIKDAIVFAKADEITAESEVELVVVKITSYYRMRDSLGENYYSKEFRLFAALPYDCKRNVPDDVETDVWSTKLGDIPAPERIAEKESA